MRTKQEIEDELTAENEHIADMRGNLADPNEDPDNRKMWRQDLANATIRARALEWVLSDKEQDLAAAAARQSEVDLTELPF